MQLFFKIKKKAQGNLGKFKVTQGSFWSLREDFLTQRVATLISYSILNNGNRNKFILKFLLIFYNLYIISNYTLQLTKY